MALTSVGLTDRGQGPGQTTNFAVTYESTLPNQARVIATANALLSVLESEFAVTVGWFGTDPAKFGPKNRQQVNLNLTAAGTTAAMARRSTSTRRRTTRTPPTPLRACRWSG